MSLDLIPPRLHQLYRFEERHHAVSILATDFKEEFSDFLLCLKGFRLKKSSKFRSAILLAIKQSILVLSNQNQVVFSTPEYSVLFLTMNVIVVNIKEFVIKELSVIVVA